jgi:hypothetical protein
MITRMTHISPVRFSVGVYRLLLAAYPKAFRDEYGPHMVQVFQDLSIRAYRQNGSDGILRLWAITLFDLLKSVVEEHLQKETNMNKSTFIRISGWSLILGAVAFAFLFLGWYLDENYPLLHWEKTYGYVSYISGFMVAPFLTAIGVLGLRSRYGSEIGAGGRKTLLVTTVAGLGLTILGILGENLDLFGRYSDTPFNLLMFGNGVHMLNLALFGFMAVSSKPLPRWNGLPIAAGIIFPIMLFLGFVLRILSEFTVAAGIGVLIQLIAMVILGFILQGDVPQEEALATA